MCSGSSAASIHSALALAAEIDAARHNGIRRGVHPASMEIKVKKEEKKNSQWRGRGMARYYSLACYLLLFACLGAVFAGIFVHWTLDAVSGGAWLNPPREVVAAHEVATLVL